MCNRKAEATILYFEDWPAVHMCLYGLTYLYINKIGIVLVPRAVLQISTSGLYMLWKHGGP